MANIITSVEIQKNNKDRVNIFINFEYSFSCDAEIVYKYDLKKSKSIELEEMKEISDLDNYLKGKNDALKVVGRSYKTEKEIREKLLKKGYEVGTIDKVVEFLKEYKFIDDVKYAQMYMNDKVQSSGKNKIKYALIRKGIEAEVVDEIHSNIDNSAELINAEELARKKYLVLQKREDDKRKIQYKLSRFLISKGYDWEIAKRVIGKILEFNE